MELQKRKHPRNQNLPQRGKDSTRPMIVAHADAGFIDRVRQEFGRLGWDVYPTQTGEDARRLARKLTPGIVVMSTDLPDQSGWLTCAKLVRESPRQKVILVSNYATPGLQDYTRFVGAETLLALDRPMQSLIDEVNDATRN